MIRRLRDALRFVGRLIALVAVAPVIILVALVVRRRRPRRGLPNPAPDLPPRAQVTSGYYRRPR